MKIPRLFSALVICCVLSTLIPSPGDCQLSLPGTWTNYPNIDWFMDMTCRDGILWCASGGGVVRFDTHDETHRVFTMGDGLPSNTDNHIEIDAQNNVWVVTNNGISRFDGIHWKTYTVATDAKTDAFFQTLFADPDGSIWASTMSLFGRFVDERWIPVEDTFYTNRNWVTAITRDHNGVLWCGCENNLYRFDGTTWAQVLVDGREQTSINKLMVDHDNNLWVMADWGVYRFDHKTWKMYPLYLVSIAESPTGEITAGTWLDGFYIWNGAGFDLFKTDSPDVPTRIQAITYDEQGNLWACTRDPRGDIVRFDGKSWKYFSLNSGYNSAVARFQVVKDSRGNTWRTVPEGVSCNYGDSVVVYTSEWGLPYPNVLSIAAGPDGVMWFGTYGRGITRFDGVSWRTYTTADGLPANYVNALGVTADGTVWAGVCKPDDDVMQGMGAAYFDGSMWKKITDLRDGVYIHDIAFDSKGTAWFATSYGVFAYGKTFSRWWREGEGLPGNQELIGFRNLIHTVEVGPDDSVWIGRYFYGGARYDGTKWELFSTESGLVYDNVLSIQIEDGKVWFYTSSGISSFTPDYINRVSDAATDQPLGFSLEGATPNPFNLSTTIRFRVHHPDRVKLTVFSATGQKEATLVDSTLLPRRYSIPWNAGEHASGVYVFRLSTPSQSVTGKMLLLK